MKTALLIISTEYYMNKPSVFIHTEGKYFGCMIYPQARKFPPADYWRTATCADSDRFFTVREVTIDDATFDSICKLQKVVDENESMIVRKSYPYIKKNWSIRRGKAYAEWKQQTEAQQKEMDEEMLRNKPFEKARYAAHDELKNILGSLQ